MEEAERALVDSFARVTAWVTNSVPVEFDEQDDEGSLLVLLDEVSAPRPLLHERNRRRRRLRYTS